MKMIVAVVIDIKSDEVSSALLEASYRITKLASTGGFLRGGTTTLMIGVEDQEVENALSIIRAQLSPPTDNDSPQATIYVLNVKDVRRV